MGFGGGVAKGALVSELCMPLLLLCWLCCWPDDSETSSSRKHPRKTALSHETGVRPRSTEPFTRRFGSSAASLHLPSTSGHTKQPLAAHRSHEEIPSRRKSNHEVREEDTRYHSAPSVIDEVIHRRDWERSSKDLYIPLKPEVAIHDSDDNSPEAPRAEPESSSIEGCKSDEKLGVTCKKHYTNIKSSRNRTKKEAMRDDVKDTDATEGSLTNFYIGDASTDNSIQDLNNDVVALDDKIKSMYKAKDAKQSFNESIKSKDRPIASIPEGQISEHTIDSLEGYQAKMFDVDLDVFVEELDRSGAMHHGMESRSSLLSYMTKHPFPPPSVEAVGYEGGACYLAEGPRGLPGRGGGRARHASDGDILAKAHRPESGAFSESDLDLELEDEQPPPYDELHRYAHADRKETAI